MPRVGVAVGSVVGVIAVVGASVGAGDGLLTVIVTCAILTFAPQTAVMVKVVVVPGVTVVLPGVATPPISLSISANCAPKTLPQLRVADCPAVIVVGDAVNDSMTGVNGQFGAGLATLRFTVSVGPKNAPLVALIRHEPE